MSDDMREPFGGRFYGIVNVEGDGPPSAMFSSREFAERVLTLLRALPEDDDDHLSEYHQVFPCDVAGAVWNSYDQDPRTVPLDAEEIAALHMGAASVEPPALVRAPPLDVEALRDGVEWACCSGPYGGPGRRGCGSVNHTEDTDLTQVDLHDPGVYR